MWILCGKIKKNISFYLTLIHYLEDIRQVQKEIKIQNQTNPLIKIVAYPILENFNNQITYKLKFCSI